MAGIIMEVHFQLLTGGSLVLCTNSTHWLSLDATGIFNPTSTTRGAYDQPLEYIDASKWQYGELKLLLGQPFSNACMPTV